MDIVDMTNFFSLTALMHFARHLSAYNIIHASLKDKKNSFVTFICVIGFGMLWSMISLTLTKKWNEILIYVIFLAIEIGIIFLTCKGSVFEKIFTGVLVAVTNLVSPVIAIQFITAMGYPYSYFVSTTIPSIPLVIYSVILILVSFFFAFIIKLVKSKITSKGKITTNKSFFFLAVPLVNLIYFLSYASIAQSLGSDAMNGPAYIKIRNTSYIVAAICLITCVGILFLVDYIDKIEHKNIENEKQILLNTLTYQQTIMLNEEKKELRKIKHDLNNLLTTATGFIEIGKPDKALEILNKTSDSVFGASKNSICSNEIISTIIYIKQQSAAGKNVELNVNIDEQSTVKIAEFDLCRLLNNLIDNSINAAEKSGIDKKSDIDISIENDYILIKTHNAFNSDNKPKKADQNHGYGSIIIKEICKKYDGNYEFYTEGNTYFTSTKIKNISI